MPVSWCENKKLSQQTFVQRLNNILEDVSPFFDLCYFLLSSLEVRNDVGVSLIRSRLGVAWLATMFSCFAGSILVNPWIGVRSYILLKLTVLFEGHPLIINLFTFIMANFAMWSMFYSPLDMMYTMVTHKAVYMSMHLALDLNRTTRILKAMKDVRRVYPEKDALVIILSVVKGNGATFMKPITRWR